MTATLQLTRKWDSVADRNGKWQMYVASLIKPDPWISLRRE